MSSNNPYEFDSRFGPEPTDSAANRYAEELVGQDVALPIGQEPGRVESVPVLGTLMFVHGVMEILFAAFLGAVTISIPDAVQRGEENNLAIPLPWSWATLGVYAAMTCWLLVLGLLHLYSGVRIRRFRGRRWGICTLSLGLLSLFGGCICFPTSVLLGGYGLLILFNQPVVLAFRLVTVGHRPEQVRQAFARIGDHPGLGSD